LHRTHTASRKPLVPSALLAAARTGPPPARCARPRLPPAQPPPRSPAPAPASSRATISPCGAYYPALGSGVGLLSAVHTGACFPHYQLPLDVSFAFTVIPYTSWWAIPLSLGGVLQSGSVGCCDPAQPWQWTLAADRDAATATAMTANPGGGIARSRRGGPTRAPSTGQTRACVYMCVRACAYVCACRCGSSQVSGLPPQLSQSCSASHRVITPEACISCWPLYPSLHSPSSSQPTHLLSAAGAHKTRR